MADICAFKMVVDKLGFNNSITDPQQWGFFPTLKHTSGGWPTILGTPILAYQGIDGPKDPGNYEEVCAPFSKDKEVGFKGAGEDVWHVRR